MNYQENWKGKNEELIKNKKIRSTKYISDATDIDRILNIRQLRSNTNMKMNTWLQNGNLTTPIKFEKKVNYLQCILYSFP